MDKHYRDAMIEHVAELEEELKDYRGIILQDSEVKLVVYRAIERAMQLLIEACIGIAKQSIKGQSRQVPSDARKTFEKMKELGMDTMKADWNSVIGMRNALVHDYLNLDRGRILAVVKDKQYELLITFARKALKSY